MASLYTFFIYLIVVLLIQQHVYFVNSLKPIPRWANSCNIASSSLICIGGEQSNSIVSSDIYKLDLANSWDTSEPLWDFVQVKNSIANAFFGAVNQGQSIIINGGLKNSRSNSQDSTLMFDVQNNIWNTLPVNRSSQPQRKKHTTTLDNQGYIWIWGGVSDISTRDNTEIIYHNTWISLNINTFSYNIPSIPTNNPSPRIDHTATLISNQEILIMGGLIYSKNVTDPSGALTLLPVSMNQLNIYNTINGIWRNETAGGNIPVNRYGYTAILHSDRGNKNIIIFGGGIQGDNKHLLNDIFVLQLYKMEWESPTVIGVAPKPRKYHQANLMDHLMIVTFGLDEEGVGYNDVNILNIAKWQWVSTYTPNLNWLSNNDMTTTDHNVTFGTNNVDNTNQKNSPHSLNVGIIAGIISGVTVLLSGGIIFILRRSFQQKEKNQGTEKLNHQQDTSFYKLNYVNSHQTMVTIANNDHQSQYNHNIINSNAIYKPNEYDHPTDQNFYLQKKYYAG
ncbi:unnamed protein product [Cunninghamella echinulata]